ncbi:acyltransferase [Clostridium sp. DJ247]|nr:acyltransferase [Clostridium sp. DJ247]
MDVMRAAAIVAVILIHVTATVLYRSSIDSSIYKDSLIVNQLSRFSVPIFILISGIGLSISYKKDENYFKFIARRFNKILPAYIVWCIIYIYFTSKSTDIHSILSNMFYGKIFYHFYYIPLIVQFYLIFPLVYRFIGNKLFLIISFLITTSIILYTRYYVPSEQMQWFLDKKNLLDWIFYFSLGSFIGNNLDEFSQKVRYYRGIIFVLFPLSIYLLLHEAFVTTNMKKDVDYITTFMRPSVLIYTTIFTLFIFSINWKDNIMMKIVQTIARNSYGIYLSHALILFYYTLHFTDNGIKVNNLTFEVKAFLVTFFGSLGINKVKKFL